MAMAKPTGILVCVYVDVCTHVCVYTKGGIMQKQENWVVTGTESITSDLPWAPVSVITNT